MDLQVILPNESPALDPRDLVRISVAAEELGLHTAWLPDHLLPPGTYGTTYGGVYEPMVTMSHLAARTDTLRFGTSVLVLPLRDPFTLAKQAAAMDRLSAGRLTLGVGIGWDAAEFANVGSDFGTRGERTDEAISLLRRLWDGAKSFDGTHYGFDGGVFEPRLERPIPIMTGGISRAAIRRAATLADEWQGLDLCPDEFAELAGELRARSERGIRVGTRIGWSGGEQKFAAAVADAQRFAEVGADALAVWFGPADGFVDRMTRFARALG